MKTKCRGPQATHESTQSELLFEAVINVTCSSHTKITLSRSAGGCVLVLGLGDHKIRLQYHSTEAPKTTRVTPVLLSCIWSLTWEIVHVLFLVCELSIKYFVNTVACKRKVSTVIKCFNLLLARFMFDSLNLADLLKGRGKPPRVPETAFTVN